MAEFSEELEAAWAPIVKAMTPIFTTQDFVDALKAHSPDLWASITTRHGPGGKGTGNYYSPANVAFNFLRLKSSDATIFRRQFVASEKGWGSPVVAQWEIVTETGSIPPEEGDLEFAEGQPKLRAHLIRERHIGLRGRVLAQREKIGLECDCCHRVAPKLNIDLQRAMFEVHHKTPLSEGTRKTKLVDVNLLCATCHRMIHRMIVLEGRNVSAEELARKL